MGKKLNTALLNTVVVGAGGVGGTTISKAAQFASEFGDLHLASLSGTSAKNLAAQVNDRYPDASVLSHRLDVRNRAETLAFLANHQIGLVLNVASPYCNESLIGSCLEAGVAYLDTAVAEDEHSENEPAPWYARVEWPLKESFAEKKLTALLGMGFDPGVVNIFCAYAKAELFDSIDTIDIIDVNGGDHGRYFATNFDPDTNLREILEDVIYWENGEFKTMPHHSRSRTVNLPVVGEHKVYSMGHDELHSLPHLVPEATRIEFWMGFGDSYLATFNTLLELGLLSSIPIEVDGVSLAPLRMVKAVLPDPASLAPDYTGEVVIGCDIVGTSGGEPRRVFVYSTCRHQECYADTASQAISYTTGVPVITAAILLNRGTWSPGTMVNVEELDPRPFLELMPEVGIGWEVVEMPLDGSWPSA